MEEWCICKICKKVFTDIDGLQKHQMTHHSHPAFRDKELPQYFRNNNSISITRVQVQQESNNSPNMQSAIMQNHSFRKTASAQGGPPVNFIRGADVAKKIGPNGRVKLSAHSPSVRNTTSIVRSGRIETDVNDGSGQWQKWQPRIENTTDAVIISVQAAKRATSAFCNSTTGQTRQPAPNVKKGPPQLLRMAPSNGKRPAPGMSTQRANPGGNKSNPNVSPSPHVKIMNNLGKMKSMNARANSRPTPASKLISVTPPPVSNKKLAQQKLSTQNPRQGGHQVSAKHGHSSQVSHNKILPRNSYNNALPKPGTQHEERIPELSSEDDDDSLLDENPVQPRAQQKSIPPAKSVSPSKTNAGNLGKAPTKKALGANRFNPITSKTTVSADKGASSNRNGSASSNPKPADNKQRAEPAQLVVARKSFPPLDDAKQITLKDLKVYVPKMPGTSYNMPSLTAVGSYTDRNGHEIWECLVCRVKEREESSRDMICCEMCEDWYHWECVGIHTSMPDEDPWYCKRCLYQYTKTPAFDFPTLFAVKK